MADPKVRAAKLFAQFEHNINSDPVVKKRFKKLQKIASEISKPDIYAVQIKKGMKFKLREASPDTAAKKGDIVTVTSVTAMGSPSDGRYNDYERIRVSNKKFSWRIDRGSLDIL